MKFTAKKDKLFKALLPAFDCAIVGTQSEYLDANKILLTAGKNLTACAHNGNVAGWVQVPSEDTNYECTDEGHITVNATDFRTSLSSFPDDEMLSFEVKDQSLVLSLVKDAEEFQQIPAQVDEVQMPSLAKKFQKEVSVKRNVFIKAMDKVVYAIGHEKYAPKFMFWVMRINPDGKTGLRAACGCGARFAVYEVEGDNIVTSSKPMNIFIHESHNATLAKMLKDCTAEDITIQEYARDDEDDSLMNQTVITMDSIKIMLVGQDPRVNWVNENRFLNRPNDYKTSVDVTNWKHALFGMSATNNQDLRSISQAHTVVLSFDFAKKTINCKSDHIIKSQRKVRIDDSIVTGDVKSTETTYLSDYVSSMVKHADSGNIQIEGVFNSAKEPLVVRFYAGDTVSNEELFNINSVAGTREKYTVFFCPYAKVS